MGNHSENAETACLPGGARSGSFTDGICSAIAGSAGTIPRRQSSHSPSVAAPACPARARLPLPMTAPVKAIFATFTADAVGLRCRPLIGALSPLVWAPTRSAVGFGLERLPGRVGHGFTPRGRKRLLILLYFGGP